MGYIESKLKNEENEKTEGIFKSVSVRFVIICFIIISSFPVIYKFYKIPSDPNLKFLSSQDDAQWIYVKRPFSVSVTTRNESVLYRKHFKIENVPPTAILSVSAMRSASVALDGQILLPYNDLREWKAARSVNISNLLTVGDHEIEISVYNENGPAVVLAYCKALNLFTGTDWEAYYGTKFLPVMLADKTKVLKLPRQFPSTYQAFHSLSLFYCAVFVIIFSLTLLLRLNFRNSNRVEQMWFSPVTVRWIVMAFWAFLAVNNITKIPSYVGYDVDYHYRYISYVASTWTVPIATQGWQMFQAPLYYFISAALGVFLSWFYNETTVTLLLRIIPLLCGTLQIELSYRAVRYVFPTRKDLQIMGIIIGGFLPMNIYISQSVSNEPLAGLFSALVLVISLYLIRFESGFYHRRYWVLLGVALGLALLTKVTAILLIPALLFLIFNVSFMNKQLKENIVGGGLTILTALLIAGWYYLFNWIKLGRPFVGGWESSLWWQDPGYRTASDFLSFGVSLTHPIYASIHGFWDSVYSTMWLDGNLSGWIYRLPPWNYNFMISGSLFALLPTVGISVGLLKIFFRPLKSLKNGQLLCAYCIYIYFMAIVYMYISVPIYSTAKATYTLGLLPCYTVTCVAGLDNLTRNIYSRAVVYSLLSCWAIAAYLSYFVL